MTRTLKSRFVVASTGRSPRFRRLRRKPGAGQPATAAPVRAVESPAVAIESSRHQRALRELEASESYSRALFHATQTGLIIADPRTEFIMDVNRAAADILGTTEEAIYGHSATICGAVDICRAFRHGATCVDRHEATLRRLDGAAVPVILSAIALSNRESDVIVISFVDIGGINAVQEQLRQSNLRLADALRQLQSQRDKIIQSEKMASIGQLAAGVAHEINNPIGYVTSNLATISEYTEFMHTLIVLYRQLASLAPDDTARPVLETQLEAVLQEEDLEFVLSDLDSVLQESVEGTIRVAEIVQNLKSFARADSQHKLPYDLNNGVEAMIRMVWNELKYSCTIEKDLAQLPPVLCHSGQINQVIMNVLVNAAHAIGQDGGLISITTSADDREAVVAITDSGSGMSPETASRIFEPFFTTKDVGLGTGLGLSISHGIVTDHGGRIEVQSALGRGSTFRICLPLAPVDAGLPIG